MKAYKGFNKDMTCRGFQYKEGETYETDKAEVCESGFHACEHPLDCLRYYGPGKSVYHEVELDGEIDRQHDGDTKVAATKIKIGSRLSIAGIVKAAVDFVMDKVKPTAGYAAHAATAGDAAQAATAGDAAHAVTAGDAAHAVTAGRFAHAATAGYAAHAVTAGRFAHAATAGYAAHAVTAGRFANAATAGDAAQAEVKSKDAIAVVTGLNCKARGGIGSWLVLTERDNDHHIKDVIAIRIDGKKYKPDTWYALKGGKVVKAGEGEE